MMRYLLPMIGATILLTAFVTYNLLPREVIAASCSPEGTIVYPSSDVRIDLGGEMGAESFTSPTPASTLMNMITMTSAGTMSVAGDNSYKVAMNDIDNTAYIAMEQSGNVVVFNTATDALITTIGDDGQTFFASELSIDTARNRLYVLDEQLTNENGQYHVYVLNSNTNTFIGNVTLPADLGYPDAVLAHEPHNQIWVGMTNTTTYEKTLVGIRADTLQVFITILIDSGTYSPSIGYAGLVINQLTHNIYIATTEYDESGFPHAIVYHAHAHEYGTFTKIDLGSRTYFTSDSQALAIDTIDNKLFAVYLYDAGGTTQPVSRMATININNDNLQFMQENVIRYSNGYNIAFDEVNEKLWVSERYAENATGHSVGYLQIFTVIPHSTGPTLDKEYQLGVELNNEPFGIGLDTGEHETKALVALRIENSQMSMIDYDLIT